MNKFATRLTELREKEELTQLELAKEIAIARPTITNWERGIREPSFDTLIKLAEFFDVSADYLLGREGYDI